MTSPAGAVEPRYADMGDQSQQSLARGLPGVWDQEPLVAVKNTFHCQPDHEPPCPAYTALSIRRAFEIADLRQGDLTATRQGTKIW